MKFEYRIKRLEDRAGITKGRGLIVVITQEDRVISAYRTFAGQRREDLSPSLRGLSLEELSATLALHEKEDNCVIISRLFVPGLEDDSIIATGRPGDERPEPDPDLRDPKDMTDEELEAAIKRCGNESEA